MPNRNRNNNSRTAGSASFTSDEFEVARILLDLPHLLKKSESSCTVLPLWNVKKKRSSIQSESPAPPSNSPSVTGKPASTSPVSPMAFPSSIESDLKLLRPRKKASVAVKAELLKQSKKLTDTREQLQTEMMKVKAYRDELMAENKLLQSRRQQMIKASSSVPISQSESLVTVARPLYHQQPLILFQYQPIGPTNLDTNGSAKKNTVRLEHPQPSDFEYHYRIWMAAMAKNRAAAALARRSRSLILKDKKCNRATRGSRL